MANSGKAKKHQEKMKRKRAEKQAKAAKYASLAGTSKKNKNIVKRQRASASSIYKHAHVMADCGNVGCKKCNPR